MRHREKEEKQMVMGAKKKKNGTWETLNNPEKMEVSYRWKLLQEGDDSMYL